MSKVWCTPLLHPAAILRGQWHKEPAQEIYLRRLVEAEREGRGPPHWDIRVPPSSDAILYPVLSQLQAWEEEHFGLPSTARREPGTGSPDTSSGILGGRGRDSGYVQGRSPVLQPLAQPFDALSLDLENAGRHVICAGLQPLHLDGGTLGRLLCLRFRRRGGARYWNSFSEHRAAVGFLAGLMGRSDITLVFHNGISHDVPLLRGLGFEVSPPWIDTLWLAHHSYSEIPKGLQFLATLHLWAPVWKTLVQDEGVDDDE